MGSVMNEVEYDAFRRHMMITFHVMFCKVCRAPVDHLANLLSLRQKRRFACDQEDYYFERLLSQGGVADQLIRFVEIYAGVPKHLRMLVPSSRPKIPNLVAVFTADSNAEFPNENQVPVCCGGKSRKQFEVFNDMMNMLHCILCSKCRNQDRDASSKHIHMKQQFLCESPLRIPNHYWDCKKPNCNLCVEFNRCAAPELTELQIIQQFSRFLENYTGIPSFLRSIHAEIPERAAKFSALPDLGTDRPAFSQVAVVKRYEGPLRTAEYDPIISELCSRLNVTDREALERLRASLIIPERLIPAIRNVKLSESEGSQAESCADSGRDCSSGVD